METKINDGGPAFPQHGWSSNPEVIERMKGQGGMTYRQWLAGMALSNLRPGDWCEIKDGVKWCFDYADAMIAHEQKPE